MTTERRAATNTGFASGGVMCKLGALCFISSVVLADSFVLRNPPERKARKRYTREKRYTSYVQSYSQHSKKIFLLK